jgi:hypothetical protein
LKTILTIIVGGAAVAVAAVYANDYWGTWDLATWIAHGLSFIPLLSMQLFLGTPQALIHFTEWYGNQGDHPRRYITKLQWNIVIIQEYDSFLLLKDH